MVTMTDLTDLDDTKALKAFRKAWNNLSGSEKIIVWRLISSLAESEKSKKA